MCHLPAPGAWNMAVDEVLLESASAKTALPALRFFAWEPVCVSIGIAQARSEIDIDALRRRDWDIVRRPTGGRAILHTDEFSYSIMAPPDDPIMHGTLMDSYNRISQALLRGLEKLSLSARADSVYTVPAGSNPKAPVCFEIPSNYEVMVGNKKIMGSAQTRRMTGILQHGSLPLHGDIGRITQILRFPDEASRTGCRERLLEHAVTVQTALGRIVTWEEAASAFAAAFSEVCGLGLRVDELTTAEVSRAQELVTSKYAHDSWTFRL